MKKIILALAGVLVLGGIGYFILVGSPKAPTQSSTPTPNQPGWSPSLEPTLHADDSAPTTIAKPDGPVREDRKETEPDPTPAEQAATSGTANGTTSSTTTTTTTTTSTSARIVTVSYQNNSFTPSTVEIKPGDTVTFVNNHTATIRIASNPHPAHTSYPALDSGNLQPNGSYSIVFAQAVTVNYHNHLNPGAMGTIIVK